jgi:hypothetical protein
MGGQRENAERDRAYEVGVHMQYGVEVSKVRSTGKVEDLAKHQFRGPIIVANRTRYGVAGIAFGKSHVIAHFTMHSSTCLLHNCIATHDATKCDCMCGCTDVP